MSRPDDDEATEHESPGTMRIDRWLFAVRLFRSRSLASQAVSGGKVHVNAERVKAARGVRAGDRITFMRGNVAFECTITGLPERRGPAREAVLCYRETPESSARRALFAEQMRATAALMPRPEGRPDKHDRRVLRRMRGRS